MDSKHSNSRSFMNYIKPNKSVKTWLVSAVALIVAVIITVTSIINYNGYVTNDGDLMEDFNTERIDSSELSKEFKTAYSKFMINMASHLTEGDENAAISITNVFSAVSLLAEASEGKTKTQLEKVLGMSADDIKKQISTLEQSVVKGENDKSGMIFSNDLLINNAVPYEVNKSFLRANGKFFGLNIHRDSFSNDLILQGLHERNAELLRYSAYADISVNKEQFMQISSVASFIGTWKNPISEENIAESKYFFESGSFDNTFFKSIEDNYIKGDTFDGVVKEFTNDFSFVALVPSHTNDKFHSLSDVFAELKKDKKYSNLLSLKKKGEKVGVILPNYQNSINTPTTTDLTDIIRKMGANDIFTRDADLQNMANNSKNLRLDRLYASGDIVITPLMHGDFSQVVEPITDKEWNACKNEVVFGRSFVYFIVDNNSGLPVYLAIVKNLL